MGLSMRERTEVDALYARVRAGDHYQILNVEPDAPQDAIRREFVRLTSWLDQITAPDRSLAEYRVRVEVVATGIQNAFRIVGNPRERMLYDDQRGRGTRDTRTPPTGVNNRAPSPPQQGAPKTNRATPEPPAPVSPARNTMTPPPRAQGPAGGASGPHSVPPRAKEATNGAAASASGPSPDTAGAERAQRMFLRLLDLLDLHLSAALDRKVSLRSSAGGGIDPRDSARYARMATDAERAEQWHEAAIFWHLASLAAPDDLVMVLRAGTAMRWAGAPQRLLDHYMRLACEADGPPGHPPAGAGDGNSVGRPSEAPTLRPPPRRR